MAVQPKVCAAPLGSAPDIVPGAQVTVKNDKGALIAVGMLASGDPSYLGPGDFVCTYPFTIAGVPSAKFYSIEVAHRGAQIYSAADLAAKHDTIDLTLDGSGG